MFVYSLRKLISKQNFIILSCPFSSNYDNSYISIDSNICEVYDKCVS